MKSLAAWVMKGLPQALIAAVGLAVIGLVLPPFTLISNAIPALVTLRQGEKQGLTLVLLLTASLTILFQLGGIALKVALLYALTQWLLPVILATWLRWKNDWPQTLQLLLIMAIIILVMLQLVYGDLSVYWLELLDKLFRPMMESAQIPEKEIESLLPQLSSRMTGAMLAGTVFTTVIVLFIARYMQALLYNPGGFQEEFRRLRLGQWPAFIVVIGLMVSLLSDLSLVREIVLIIMTLYFIQGVAVVHSLVAKNHWHSVWLISMYTGLILLTVPFGMILAALGLMDEFLDFRKRLAKQT